MIQPPSEPLSQPDESLRSFLAERDTPCPGCNYNLRGVEQPVCPECGLAIELTISRPGRSRGFLLFVLLALGWVLTAGTMNGVRMWRTVRQEATTSGWAPLMTRTFGTINSGPFQIVTPSTGSSRTTITIPQTRTLTSSSVVISSGGSISFSSGRTITSSPSTSYTWSNVSTRSWELLGWWSGLAILALAWLIVCLIRRRRFGADQPPRPLIAGACILFALYAGYHAVMFTREFIT